MLNDGLPKGSQDTSLAEGHVFSSALIPYIHDVDAQAGITIGSNLAFNLNNIPVEDGQNDVFDAFRNAINKMNDINCRDIGSLANNQFCLVSTSAAPNFMLNTWIVVCTTIILGLQVHV